jgi:oligopeptide/dipeptide ABC transporter ATP-binding protein
MKPLLSITGLAMRFRSPNNRKKIIHAVDGVSFDIHEGEIVGIVGESGSGKSTIGRCILNLETASEGKISFDGSDLTGHSSQRNRLELAAKLQVVFQDPYSSLNPYLTIGQALAEPFTAARAGNAAAARAKAQELLAQVGLPADAVDRYPSEFSGGQRQRIGIARALMLDPKLVICDEAVSALDLSTQAQVLNLLASLARERNLAYMFIAHDLDVVHYIADRTIVLYRGRVMESGPADAVHTAPLHPYTAALLASAPVTDPAEQAARRAARSVVKKTVSTTPQPATGQTGCPFAARCAFAEAACVEKRPIDAPVGARRVACHMYDAASGHSAHGAGMPAIPIQLKESA